MDILPKHVRDADAYEPTNLPALREAVASAFWEAYNAGWVDGALGCGRKTQEQRIEAKKAAWLKSKAKAALWRDTN